MLKFHAALNDPSPEQIFDTLTAAAAGANKRCRTRKLADKPADWRKFAREFAAAPEGWRMWRGGRGGTPASQVLAAWWTDPIGRKHVVARGRRVEATAARALLHEADLGERCPLWHAYPGYVYRRTTGRKVEWVCVCGCGAVGTPAALGWMGETCGPCFDRQQEHGPDALRQNRPGVLYGERGPLEDVAVSPDGRWVAARESATVETGLNVWAAATGARREVKGQGSFALSDVAFTAAGSLLLLKYGDALHGDPAADPVALRKLSDAGGHRLAVPRAADLVVRVSGMNHRMEVSRGDGAAARWVDLPEDINGAVAASPDGRLVALGGAGRFIVLNLATFAQLAEVPFGRPRFILTSVVAQGPTAMAFSADGTRLFATDMTDIVAFDPHTGKRGVVGKYTHRGAKAARLEVNCLAVSPDGKHLFAGDTAGRLAVLDADTLKTRVAFDWHIGHVNGIAVAAGGDVLYTCGADGTVKVWPIRQLLAAGSP